MTVHGPWGSIAGLVFLIYITAPIRDSQPVPNEVPGQAPSNIISLPACPDEYEPAPIYNRHARQISEARAV